MDTELQRSWEYIRVSPDARDLSDVGKYSDIGPTAPVDRSSIYSRISEELVADGEMLVLPSIYEANPELFDDVVGIGYLMVAEWDDSVVDFVFQSDVRNSTDLGFKILLKVYIVRIRLPWSKLKYEWIITKEELDERRSDYEVTDVYFKVIDKEQPEKPPHTIEKVDYQLNRDRYTITDIRYLVRWKTPKKIVGRIAGIDPRNVHKVLSR